MIFSMDLFRVQVWLIFVANNKQWYERWIQVKTTWNFWCSGLEEVKYTFCILFNFFFLLLMKIIRWEYEEPTFNTTMSKNPVNRMVTDSIHPIVSIQNTLWWRHKILWDPNKSVSFRKRSRKGRESKDTFFSFVTVRGCHWTNVTVVISSSLSCSSCVLKEHEYN